MRTDADGVEAGVRNEAALSSRYGQRSSPATHFVHAGLVSSHCS